MPAGAQQLLCAQTACLQTSEVVSKGERAKVGTVNGSNACHGNHLLYHMVVAGGRSAPKSNQRRISY